MLTQNSNLTWRWCFWINLPLGGLVLLIIFLCLDKSAGCSQQTSKRTLCERLKHLDLLGNLLMLAATTCLLLSVKPIGGKKYPNRTARVVTSVLTSILSVALLVQQRYRNAEGLIPKRIIHHRAIWATCGLLLFLAAGMANHIFFLPSVLQVRFAVAAWNHLSYD
jgi:MFS family permease